MGRASFTLIELLIVIAIVAVLSTVAILVLNPAELLKQARDGNRLSDLNTINKALQLYDWDIGGSLGTASTTYISIPDPAATSSQGTYCTGMGLPALPSGWSYRCAHPNNYRKVDGSGWLPLPFTNLTTKSPLASLPVDPINTTSSNNYYTYTVGGSWALSTLLESPEIPE